MTFLDLSNNTHYYLLTENSILCIEKTVILED